MKLFFELANELLPLAPVFMDGFMDHELEDFRAFINWRLGLQPKSKKAWVPAWAQSSALEEFDEDLMATVLYYCDLENNMFGSVAYLSGFRKAWGGCEEVTDWIRYGPTGIIRYTKNTTITRKTNPTKLVDSCPTQ
jgi:hypothetical protein